MSMCHMWSVRFDLQSYADMPLSQRYRCRTLISNNKDDINEFDRDIGIEGGNLMRKVLQKKVILRGLNTMVVDTM